MTESLEVWLSDELIGTLRPTRKGACFRYSDTAITRELGQPLLSTALRVQPEEFDASITRSWFTGLLPEDVQRAEVFRIFDLSRGSYTDMLREIGWECAGAVVISEPGTAPHTGSFEDLTEPQLAQRLTALPARPYDTPDTLRVSLGGYQAKMLLTKTNDGWALPIGGAISTHILKPQSQTRWPELIVSEAWTMAVAEHATPTAQTELLELDEAPLTLVVERFDRTISDARLTRTHQEDACQAMGLPPESKYALPRANPKSGPSHKKMAALLRDYSADPDREMQRLLEQVTVNVAVGNTDAHAKNYGILHPEATTISLSPLYDVLPAMYIVPDALQMGMRVNNILRIDRVERSSIVSEGVSWGMREATARTIVSETLEKLSAATMVASERYPETPKAVTSFVKDRITALQGTPL